MRTLRNHLIIALVLVAVCGVLVLTGQQRPAGPYTADQAAAGRTVFQANCAGCHGPDLAGRNDAPQLAGTQFMANWGGRTASELINFMASAMPPGNATLGEQNYVNITAYILDSNGARPGTQALAASNAAAIRTFATGQATAQIAGGGAGGGKQGKQQAKGGGKQAPAAPRGLTVTGQAK